MVNSERWRLGDVIIWFKTGDRQDAKTDSDVYLRFYNTDDDILAWVHAFERGDMGGFEEGELNCGYLGNLDKQAWLKSLLDAGTRVGVRIERVSDDRPEWFLESINLDFRIGPTAANSTVRTWEISEWIHPGADERTFECVELVNERAGDFGNVGFERELEVEAGGAEDDPPQEE